MRSRNGVVILSLFFCSHAFAIQGEVGGAAAFQFEKEKEKSLSYGGSAQVRGSVLFGSSIVKWGVSLIADIREIGSLPWMTGGPFLRVGKTPFLDLGAGFANGRDIVFTSWGLFGAIGANVSSSVSVAFQAVYRSHHRSITHFSCGPMVLVTF